MYRATMYTTYKENKWLFSLSCVTLVSVFFEWNLLHVSGKTQTETQYLLASHEDQPIFSRTVRSVEYNQTFLWLLISLYQLIYLFSIKESYDK